MPVPHVSILVGFPTNLENGSGLPFGVGVRGGFSIRNKEKGWGFALEAGFGMSFYPEFRFSPQILVGPSYKFDKNFIMALSAVYKLTPPYDGKTSHTLTGVVAFIFPIVKNFLFAIPIGVGYNFTKQVPFSVVGIKAIIAFPQE